MNKFFTTAFCNVCVFVVVEMESQFCLTVSGNDDDDIHSMLS